MSSANDEHASTMEAPAAPSLRSRAIHASSWRLSIFVLVKVLRLGTSIALAWLLTPAAFGIVALAESVSRGLNMFSEIGIGPAIVQSKHGDDPTFLNTAWTMQVIRGFGLALAMFALAGPLAIFYKEPALVAILPAIGITAIVQGFNSTSYFTLNRTLNEKHRALLDLARAIITRGSMIAFALLVVANEWALVVGTATGAVFFTLFSHVFLPGIRNRFMWDRKAAHDLARFGLWVFIGTVIAFFGQQADRLLLGKLDTLSVLGIYGIALTVSQIPVELSMVLVGTVFFPALSEANRRSADDLANRVLRMRRSVLLAGLFLTICVVVASPMFFELFYRPEYHAAAWIAPLTCLTTWIMLLNDSANRTLLSLAKTRALAFSSLIRVAVTIPLCLIGYSMGPTPTLALVGFIVGTSLGALASHIANLIVLSRCGVGLVAQDLRFTASAIVLAALAVFVDRGLAQSIESHLFETISRIGAGGLLAGCLGLFVLHQLRSEFRR